VGSGELMESGGLGCPPGSALLRMSQGMIMRQMGVGGSHTWTIIPLTHYAALRQARGLGPSICNPQRYTEPQLQAGVEDKMTTRKTMWAQCCLAWGQGSELGRIHCWDGGLDTAKHHTVPGSSP
jgi:hypothetical protein